MPFLYFFSFLYSFLLTPFLHPHFFPHNILPSSYSIFYFKFYFLYFLSNFRKNFLLSVTVFFYTYHSGLIPCGSLKATSPTLLISITTAYLSVSKVEKSQVYKLRRLFGVTVGDIKDRKFSTIH